MNFIDSTSAITRIGHAQTELCDHTGHVNRGTPRARVFQLVDEINRLRAAVGWPPFDMAGRWRR